VLRAAPSREVAHPEADEHDEPRGPVIGIHEGTGEARGGGADAPAEDPRLAEEVVHDGEKGHHGARHQKDAHEPIELLALPDQIHHEQVDAGVCEEEQQRPPGLGRRHCVEEEEARGEGRGAGRGRGERPRAQRPVADHELEQDEREEEDERLVESGGRPLELAGVGHAEGPGEKPGKDEELGDDERPATMRAARQRGPEERRVEDQEGGAPEPSRLAVTREDRCRSRHGRSADPRHGTRRRGRW